MAAYSYILMLLHIYDSHQIHAESYNDLKLGEKQNWYWIGMCVSQYLDIGVSLSET